MFILAAMLCTSLEITSCEAVIWPTETFPTEEACNTVVSVHRNDLDLESYTMWKLYCYKVPGTEV